MRMQARWQPLLCEHAEIQLKQSQEAFNDVFEAGQKMTIEEAIKGASRSDAGAGWTAVSRMPAHPKYQGITRWPGDQSSVAFASLLLHRQEGEAGMVSSRRGRATPIESAMRST